MQEEEKYLNQSFDEIVFENRNKLYGSYMLRGLIPQYTKTGLLISAVAVILFTGYTLVDFNFINRSAEPIYFQTEVMLSEPPPLYESLPPAVPPAIKKAESTELTEMEVKKDEEVPETVKTVSDEQSDTTNNGTSETGTTAQSEKTGDGHTVYTKVDKMPEYPGGPSGLVRYLKDNVDYPKVAKENNIIGTVKVYFVVDVDGSVTNAKIIQGIGGGCDQEALRVVNEMRRWKPGMNGGHPVPVGMTLPITFNLSDGG